MAIGDTITSPLPTVGGSVDTWGSVLNTFLTELKNTVEAKVTTGGLDINADLDLNKNVLLDTGAIAFSDQAAVLTGAGDARKLYTKSGELYFTDSGLTAVQITSGGALNAAALQGITGAGYGSNGVEITWVSGSSEYRFKKGPLGDEYAVLVADGLYLRDGSGNQLKMFAPVGMSADYSLTWPPAAPASGTRLLGISNTGTVSYDPTFTSGTFTDLTVTNPLKHGAYQKVFGPGCITAAEGNWVPAGTYWGSTAINDEARLSLPLQVGERITSINVYFYQPSAAAVTIRLVYIVLGTETILVDVNSSTAVGWKTHTLTPSHTVVAGREYAVTLRQQESGVKFSGVQVTYDHP